ncbi:MAG TPA: methyltransferase [Chloroflexota bacterium]|nr:methyltransferase [Chloroflexota bacterium]
MPSWDTQRYFMPLLREHVALTPTSRVLELGFYDPEAALWAAREGAEVLALRPTVDQVTELDRRAREAGLTNLEARLALHLEPAERGRFHLALLLVPYFLGNAPSREAIDVAAGGLAPGGQLAFQVHHRHGGRTFVKHAATRFSAVAFLGMGGGQRRLYRASGPLAPAAGQSPPPEPAAPLEVTLRGVALRLRLAAGVFASKGIDPATRLLLQTAELPPAARVLDLGCGAGTIGLAVAAADPRAFVVLVDSSRPAVDLARENAALNNVRNVDLRLDDGYRAVPGERFDAILSNLPAHRGHQADAAVAERFIVEAPAYLREDGSAWFVANRALPYELPASRAFRQVRLAASDGRYKVLHCSGPRQ